MAETAQAKLNPNPVVYNVASARSGGSAMLVGDTITPGEVYDYIRDIMDPEHPYTLEQLKVVEEEKIAVVADDGQRCHIVIEYTPTVPHCSLATLIGLCMREKLARCLGRQFKLDIFVTKGKHSTEAEINKQVNDKERVAAALENPNLLQIVEQCIRDRG